MDLIHNLLSRIELNNINILLLLGLSLFGGTIGGRLFQKIKIPQVVGYIIIGIIIGKSGFNIVNNEIIEVLQPFNYFALGLIGLMIGGELKKDVFKKYGKQFITILLSEGLLSFIFVTFFTGIVLNLFLDNAIYAWSGALLLGAISSATAPAATTDVLWEYRTSGPLTKTILGIVAMDDGLALILFAVVSNISLNLISSTNSGMLSAISGTLTGIGGSIITGMLTGYFLSALLKRYSEEDRILAFSIGIILALLGLCIFLNLDMLLAAMATGFTITNFSPRKSFDVFKLIGRFTPPIYVLFFVLVGAKLYLQNITFMLALVTLVYFLSRTGGKMTGAFLGAKLSKAPETVRKYLPLCLFSQAGVAIGLSILSGQRFPGEIGNIIIVVITTSTFIVQLIGPGAVKTAVTKAGEVGLNITEKDLIKKYTAIDALDKNCPLFNEQDSLETIFRHLSRNDNMSYPVVDQEKHIKGIITFDGLKNTFLVPHINNIFLAADVMDPVSHTVFTDTPLVEVKYLMKQNSLDSLVVLERSGCVKGVIESRLINRLIARQMQLLQIKSDALG